MTELAADIRYLLARGKAAAMRQLRSRAPRQSQWKSLEEGPELHVAFREEVDVTGRYRLDGIADPKALARFAAENAQWRLQENRIECVEGEVWIEPGHSLITVPGRRVLESSRGVHREIEPVAPAPPEGAEIVEVEGLVHFDGFLALNLWHLFADSLNPLLWLLRSGRLDRDVPVLIHRRLWDAQHVRYYLDLPQLSGIRWLVQEEGQWVRARHVTKASATHGEFRRTYEMLDDRASKRPHRRIFLDRRPRYRRRLENDSAILPLLAKRGFERIFAEELSYAEQVALFRETQYLVGLHGAGLTNMLHAEAAELRVLEILTETYLMPHYYWLSQTVGALHYDALVGSPLNWRGNYRVDPAALEQRLDAMLAA